MDRRMETLVIANTSEGILVIPSIHGPKKYLAD